MTALVLVGAGLFVLFVWQPCLLRQIVAPPIIDRGYHTSKQWTQRRDRYWAEHPRARCCVTFRRESRSFTVLSFERGVVLWKPVLFKTRVGKLALHEAVYPSSRRSHISDFWLFPMTPEAHRKLHQFDRALWPALTLGLWKDRRNRLLWLSTLLYVYGRYALVVLVAVVWWKVTH